MLNFVIYEDNKMYLQKNVNCINKALVNYDIDYRIHKFDKYSDKILDIVNDKNIKKIYILDVEMPDVSGIELASKIRKVDWDSIIIFATAYDKYHNDVFYTRLMVLDFVCKYNGYENRLIDDIKAAFKIVYDQKTFVFKYNHVMYRIPYDQICYIEKEPIIKRCIIHTVNNQFYVVDSINNLIDKLGGSFCKTHQSCIINLNNIKSIDLANNMVIFENGLSTNMLTNKMKKVVKDCVGVN